MQLDGLRNVTLSELLLRAITCNTGLGCSKAGLVQLVSPILIGWIVIYPVDSVIQHLNNWGQVCYG